MDTAGQALYAAGEMYVRQATNTTTGTSAATESRPPVYKAIGISLAIASGVFIGVSFVFKKVGLLKANEKYDTQAGEGYAYLKNAFWWSGMTLMIIGEICNFVAYAFVDAILVTPLGALSVVITTILSAIFLKERLSLVGKVGCFLCIIGSVVIVMNAPSESSAANIQEMQSFVIAPGFLSYAGVIILICIFIALWAGPRYGKKSMMVYLSICSLIGGLSVVATQGLGAAIVAQIGGTPQFNQWFLYVLFVFVLTTLITEIIYLNKALNLFNAALVTPTYYVCFTSSTIVTSAILFRGFKGTPTSIITVVMGFFVICSGVVLLQLSKSAKDVPDTAVFAGDLDQVRTIAEQEQPESEPKADAIRGAGLGTIVRRFSVTRQKMEQEELRRLHEEKLRDLEPLGEGEVVEWDGLRRRRTQTFGPGSRVLSPRPPTAVSGTPAHPPLGMSHFPSYEDMLDEESRPTTGNTGFHSSFLGSVRDRARSMIQPGSARKFSQNSGPGMQSPMHPVALTEIPTYRGNDPNNYSEYDNNHHPQDHVYGLPSGLRDHKTAYEGAAGDTSHHIHFSNDADRSSSRGTLAPEPPLHSAKRQFSFHNVFKKGQSSDSEQIQTRAPASRKGLGSRQGSHQSTKGATEEERLGLVKGDTNISQNTPYVEHDESADSDLEEEWEMEGKRTLAEQAIGVRGGVPIVDHGRERVVNTSENAGRQLSGRELEREKMAREKEEEASSRSPPKTSRSGGGGGSGQDAESYAYEQRKRRFEAQRENEGRDQYRGPPPPFDDRRGYSRGGNGNQGAFI